MIVRHEEGWWTLVRQMDHAAHCGQIARAWRSGPFGADAVSAALEYAAGYHDLGWDEVDGEPEAGAGGAPLNFTQFEEARHAKFYSGAVRTIARTDPHAAFLVSLHASGLYSGRYGWRGFRTTDWASVGQHGRALLSGEREFRARVLPSLDAKRVEFEQAWRDYMLLETFDYLSLLTCFGLDSPGCGPVPAGPGRFSDLTVTRVGPWEVGLDPFPFAGEELAVEVVRVRLEAERFESNAELREMFNRAPREKERTLYRRGG
ncbi:MAG TPA: DUF3891 family protein [Candidatus Dormibacteraeota bacterium]|nr:DUF3891 family protein [Candidatus Dormibacteraeota bacterium]